MSIPLELQGETEAIAKQFLANTGKRMVINSAHRDAGEQASAMYDNLIHKRPERYVDRGAFSEIQNAYQTGQAAKRPQAEIIGSMQQIIQDQMARGVYISDHLAGSGRAIDIHLPSPQSRSDNAALKQAVTNHAGIWLDEGTHLHVKMSGLRGYQ